MREFWKELAEHTAAVLAADGGLLARDVETISDGLPRRVEEAVGDDVSATAAIDTVTTGRRPGEVVADELEQMYQSGQRAAYWRSGPGKSTFSFQKWMQGGGQGDLPPFGEKTVFNCKDMIYYAAARKGMLPREELPELAKLEVKKPPHLSGRRSFTPGKPGGRAPKRGDLVVWGDGDHVSLATGKTINGSPEVYSFWPQYDDPSKYPPGLNVTISETERCWLIPIQKVTIDELNTYWIEEEKSPIPKIWFGRGPFVG